MNEQQLIEFIHSLLPNSSFYIHCGAYYGIHNRRKKNIHTCCEDRPDRLSIIQRQEAQNYSFVCTSQKPKQFNPA